MFPPFPIASFVIQLLGRVIIVIGTWEGILLCKNRLVIKSRPHDAIIILTGSSVNRELFLHWIIGGLTSIIILLGHGCEIHFKDTIFVMVVIVLFRIYALEWRIFIEIISTRLYCKMIKFPLKCLIGSNRSNARVSGTHIRCSVAKISLSRF